MLGGTIPKEQTHELSDKEYTTALIAQEINYIKALSMQGDDKRVECVNHFIEQINILHHAYFTEGASDQTIVKDIESVRDVLKLPSATNIYHLCERIEVNNRANAIRRNWGIIGATAGIALLTLSGIGFFAGIALSVPMAATAAATGSSMGITGSGIAIDANFKRGKLAISEQAVLDDVLKSLLDNKDFVSYVRAKLAVIKSNAEYREKNFTRDALINNAIKSISETMTLTDLTQVLNELEQDILGNKRSSKAAVEVAGLINHLQEYIEQTKITNFHY